MQLSTKFRARLTILYITITGTILFGFFIQDISELIHFLGERPAPTIPSIFLMVIDKFTWELLTVGSLLFYAKIFFDKLINAYMVNKNCSLTQLIEEGNFEKNYFKIKNDEVITRFYKQRKVIKFLKNL
jgi:hypothetical protein